MERARQVVTALYQQALKNQHCDVKITSHGKVYGAHRGVLVQASPYFNKLFSGSFKECYSGEISFTEIVQDTDMFEAILGYIYLGSLDLEVHAPKDVLQVASLLLLDDLVKCCQQVLLERLTLDNALHTWAWAHLYNLKALEEVCRALCRSRFHDTIIHQPDTMKLPVDILCYIIKEGVLDFVDETTKLNFLQTWLQKHTRKRLIESKGIMAKVSSELKEVEPNVAAALQEPDFLSKHFQCTESHEGQVDCIICVTYTISNTKTVSVCDLKTGKWYESSDTTPFLKYSAVAGQLIVFQNYEKDKLSKRVDPPCIKLQIRQKKDSSYLKCGLRFPVRLFADKSDHSYRSCCGYYPYINQLWRYESDEEGWRELHPPPCNLGYSLWNRTRVSQSLLKSLDPIKPRITVIGGDRNDSEDGEGPFAHYEFVAEEL